MRAALDAIVDHHRRRVDDDPRFLEDVLEAARQAPMPRDFLAPLSGEGISLIAEIKRASPSRGELAPDLVAGELARAYAEGGAACLSVLTDMEFFGGSWVDLVEARETSGLPVLRKDFVLSELDVCDTRLGGADAVLLIAAVLGEAQLAELHSLATELGLTALVEAHDEGELERALACGARLVGVNQRDLGDFSVDHGRASRLAALIPPGVASVAESGVRGPDDVRRAADAGYSAVLVGEHLVTSDDPRAEAQRLLGAGG